MPPRQDDKETCRKHVIIYKDDYEQIMALWGEHPGFSFAVRNIIHKYLRNMNERAVAKASTLAISNDEIDSIVDGGK